MPKIAADRLERIAGGLLVAAGASAAEADIVSRHLIGANLAGHDSHGVIHIPGYIASIQRGHMQPGAPFDIIQESRATTVVDGNWGFGFTVSERAMQLTIDKARQEKRRCRHCRAPGPRRASDRLSINGRPSRHDRADDR